MTGSAGWCNALEPQKYGYVDEKGVLVIPCQYDQAKSFDYSSRHKIHYAYVAEADELWGTIDRQGKALIKPQLLELCAFQSIVFLARQSENRVELISFSGEVLGIGFDVDFDTDVPSLYHALSEVQRKYLKKRTQKKSALSPTQDSI